MDLMADSESVLCGLVIARQAKRSGIIQQMANSLKRLHLVKHIVRNTQALGF